MDIGKEMFDKAIDFLGIRYGENKAGGVAVLRTLNGEYLISIWPEVIVQQTCVQKLAQFVKLIS